MAQSVFSPHNTASVSSFFFSLQSRQQYKKTWPLTLDAIPEIFFFPPPLPFMQNTQTQKHPTNTQIPNVILKQERGRGLLRWCMGPRVWQAGMTVCPASFLCPDSQVQLNPTSNKEEKEWRRDGEKEEQQAVFPRFGIHQHSPSRSNLEEKRGILQYSVCKNVLVLVNNTIFPLEWLKIGVLALRKRHNCLLGIN